MDSLFDAVRKFTAITIEYEAIRHAALEAGAKKFINYAKDAIGTYEYGWVPLQPATIAKHGDTPLLDTGAMRDSGSYEMRGDHAVAGFTDEKIVYHEFGTSRIPPRPVVGGTIDKHGREIAEEMGVVCGSVIGLSLASSGSISSVIGAILGRK